MGDLLNLDCGCCGQGCELCCTGDQEVVQSITLAKTGSSSCCNVLLATHTISVFPDPAVAESLGCGALINLSDFECVRSSDYNDAHQQVSISIISARGGQFGGFQPILDQIPYATDDTKCYFIVVVRYLLSRIKQTAPFTVDGPWEVYHFFGKEITACGDICCDVTLIDEGTLRDSPDIDTWFSGFTNVPATGLSPLCDPDTANINCQDIECAPP